MVRSLLPLNVAEIRSSPARRCREPADRIAVELGCPGAEIDGRLAELDFGRWEGRDWNDIDRPALDRWAADPLGFAPPGGETGAQLIARVGAFFESVRGRTGPVAVLTHGGPLKVLLALAKGVPIDLFAPAPPFASVNVVVMPVRKRDASLKPGSV